MLANGRTPAKGAPIDDDRSQEALLLVHEWTLPGDGMPLDRRLGAGRDLPGSRPTWSVERTGDNGYRATFQESPGSATYAFDVDLESRSVWPTADTQELLTPSLAALGDAPR